jgi:hypothetical protein
METKEKFFTLEAGRLLLREGVPFISIHREEQTPPVQADETAKLIVRLLNKAVAV